MRWSLDKKTYKLIDKENKKNSKIYKRFYLKRKLCTIMTFNTLLICYPGKCKAPPSGKIYYKQVQVNQSQTLKVLKKF